MPLLKIGSLHFLISLLIITAVGLLIFYLWFPFPYAEMLGGRKLFWLIVSVDVITGPLLTVIVFNPNKSLRSLTFDIGCICFIQLLALIYGSYTLWAARPVFMAFEVDRFQIVTYADILKEDLNPESNPLHRLPLKGIKVIGTRMLANGDDMLESLELSMQGFGPATRPEWWQDYSKSLDMVRQRARPVADLVQKRPENADMIRNEILKIHKMENDLVWLPVTSFRTQEWVTFLDKETMLPVFFLPIDGFLGNDKKTD